MARTTNIKIPGLNAYVDKIKNTLSEAAARDIVIDLKIAGPYWSGEFEQNWVVKRGSVGVAATKQSSFAFLPEKQPKDISDFDVPPATGRGNITYSIANRMEYRDIAMDLKPDATGKLRGDRPGRTADKYWYDTYVNTELRDRLKKTTDKVARLPRIKNFRGRG